MTAYNWSHLPDVGGWKAGVGLNDLKRLVSYWRDSYDWRKTERRLNQLPHFITTIGGQPIHYIRYKSGGNKPAISLLHGWPGSFLEFGTITQALGAKGHDVIVPSLPGFAFSHPITEVLEPRRIAELMSELMKLLFNGAGYVVQGGDWGAHIASWMVFQKPEGLLGIHINMASIYAVMQNPKHRKKNTYLNAAQLF